MIIKFLWFFSTFSSIWWIKGWCKTSRSVNDHHISIPMYIVLLEYKSITKYVHTYSRLPKFVPYKLSHKTHIRIRMQNEYCPPIRAKNGACIYLTLRKTLTKILCSIYVLFLLLWTKLIPNTTNLLKPPTY